MTASKQGSAINQPSGLYKPELPTLIIPSLMLPAISIEGQLLHIRRGIQLHQVFLGGVPLHVVLSV